MRLKYKVQIEAQFEESTFYYEVGSIKGKENTFTQGMENTSRESTFSNFDQLPSFFNHFYF